MWRVGERIRGRWEVRDIHKGGMGIVYVVYDHEEREVLAAKTFQTERLDRRLSELFLKEALIWLHLDAHENVTEARHAETIGEQPYLFLQYASGGDLSRRIGSDWLLRNPARIALLGVQFCDGMLHVLSRGVQAHRDIKPANCLLSDRNVLQITDFGLIKVRETLLHGLSGVRLPQTEATGGTLTHMAPEQFTNPGSVDLRADVYAFGVVLYQMLCGRLPFMGRSYDDWARRHCEQAPTPLSGVHKGLASIALRCLEKDRERRYGRFEALREELAGIREELTGRRPPSPSQDSALDAAKMLNKAAGLGNLGYWDAEIALCDDLLITHRHSAALWICKGTALLGAGQIAEADACYERAAQLDPSDATAWANRTATLRRLGRLQDAARCARRAIQLDPQYGTAWLNLGTVAAQLGDLEEALQLYDEALRCDPLDHTALSMRTMILLQSDRPKEALASCETALERAPRDVRLWLLAAECHDALEALGSGEEEARERAAARQCRGRVMRMDPEHPLLALDMAHREAKAGRWKNAHVLVNDFLGQDQTSGRAWSLQGRVLLHSNRASDAVQAYRRAVALEPWSIPHHVNLGLAYGHTGGHEQALRAFDAALRMDPTHDGAWQGKRTAIRHLAEDAGFARRLAGGGLYPDDPLDCYTLGALAGNRGEWAEAIHFLERAVDQAPAMQEAWYLFGLALAESGAFSRAVPCFERARDLGHPDAGAYALQCKIRLSTTEAPPRPRADTSSEESVAHCQACGAAVELDALWDPHCARCGHDWDAPLH